MAGVILVFIWLVFAGIVALIAGKRFAILLLGLTMGYDLLNQKIGGFLGIGGTTPQLVNCINNFSSCTNSQIMGLLIIIGSIALAFIPSSKFK